ncbi:Cloroperoxidase [Sistotremastrum suecicum HHB10207 ss-3]|uniref:Cloroperoxidase n=1 Tax=Sistotremastrum suecicum HHB10207 ss-3 TaxID=1314776 RepID=A0A165Z4P2_9AGAM|nr:Cloroperoxidase [Sistotremastrum suecicum HHB10207 ss-3]
MPRPFLLVAGRKLSFAAAAIVFRVLSATAFFSVDLVITVLNVVLPQKPMGKVIPYPKPGAKGLWPQYRAPLESDSRSACPALNAMCNHGILARDGRKLSFKDISAAIQDTYNFSPTFSFFVPHYAAQMLGRDYFKDTVDLNDFNVHNGIEHDASLTRMDHCHEPEQHPPHHHTIDRLLNCATGIDPLSSRGRKLLTDSDLAVFSGIRRVESRLTNPQYTLDTFHKLFGSNNAATMTTIFGGKLDDLSVWLKEERLPDGWEPRRRDRFGVSMLSFNRHVLAVELAVEEPDPKFVRASMKEQMLR